MNRVIKFKGRRKITGQWLHGSLSQDEQYSFINEHQSNGWEPIDPATVGQYTGLKDLDGNEIYEGDVLANNHAVPSEVVFADGCFRLKDGNDQFGTTLNQMRAKYLEIVGNIHEEKTVKT